ncbi:hypothetical protein [Cohnella cholangitidis]|uniref:EscU/YscU/HrcU family type III secretion system export apparatus switch protein n=1 Tax=Cohnella cholangitidis TaxID=2598458 RepID=A0A7G5BS63_9BACL|nr:hypothetical protein [Cohnella cholangitidis]QMV39797.1 EscU/YscU/HrcU family type III secretion system export apparatus switch protein [Cohnella cholangitidis]
MEVVDRYIYAVTQRLPERQRGDIRQELQGLIEDMLEERAPAGQASREDVESVLLELGNPNALAAKYRGYDRYLISPMMFESYVTTLKIVLISISVAMTVLFAMETIFSPTEIMAHFTSFLVSLFTAVAQGFGWVTVIFALIDYRQHKVGNGSAEKKEWKPSDLPEIPSRNTHIKMSDPIASIIFIVLFTVICLYSIDLLGIWRFNDGERVVIPFLNADAFQDYLPIIWILAALGILKESIRIIVRKRTGKILAFHVAISVASTVLVCIVLADSAIWNPDLIQQLEAAGILSARGEGYDTVVSIWTRVTDWLINIIVLYALIDILSETYRWYRAKTSS